MFAASDYVVPVSVDGYPINLQPPLDRRRDAEDAVGHVVLRHIVRPVPVPVVGMDV